MRAYSIGGRSKEDGGRDKREEGLGRVRVPARNNKSSTSGFSPCGEYGFSHVDGVLPQCPSDYL